MDIITLSSLQRDGDENLETICKTYADMGIRGFRWIYGPRRPDRHRNGGERLAACTAKHHLIPDLHGIYQATYGLNRTYPKYPQLRVSWYGRMPLDGSKE